MTNLRSKGDYRLELFVEASPSVQVLSNLGLRLCLDRTDPPDVGLVPEVGVEPTAGVLEDLAELG